MILYGCQCTKVDCLGNPTVMIAYQDADGNNLMFGDYKKYTLSDISISTVDENNHFTQAIITSNSSISSEWIFVELLSPDTKMLFSVNGIVKDSFSLGFETQGSECCPNVIQLSTVSKNNISLEFRPVLVIKE